jgi:iron complex transport system substrate-binding protein
MSQRKTISRPWLFFWISLAASSVLVTWLNHWESKSEGETSRLRIISLTPNVTEMIFAFGAEKELVGISDYCEIPTTMSLPRCGGLLNPNYERILALHPSTVFLLGRMDRIASFASDHHIQPVSVNIDSFSDLIREMEIVGKMVNRETIARNMTSQFKARIEEVKKNASKIPHYRCLILIARENGALRKMIAIGGPSYISEMLNAAGGKNIYSEQKQGYFYASLESIQALQPEIIFEIRAHTTLDAAAKNSIYRDWLTAQNVPAVKNHRIIIATEDVYTTPGPRMPEIAELFQKYLMQISNDGGIP